jgi:phospholipid/cholesterol/gamma-HCH transport system substrate-binding protein
MQRSVIETIMGGVVLIVAGFFLVLAYETTDLSGQLDGYRIEARFGAIDGLTLGSDVRLAGVKIGTVTDQRMDPELFQAIIGLEIDNGVRIPSDSALAISADGLLGGTYVKVMPGTADTMLAEGRRGLQHQGRGRHGRPVGARDLHSHG